MAAGERKGLSPDCRSAPRHVAEAAHRLDQIAAELAPDAPDKHLDRIGIAIEILIVEMLDQLGAGDDAALVVHEIGEEPILVRGQLHGRSIGDDTPGAGVERDRTADELARRVAGGAAQERPEPRQQLLHVKRLGDVIVRAGVEGVDLVAPAIARRQHQDRHGLAARPPGGDDRGTVLLRQAEVQDHGVIRLGLAQELALLAVHGAVDRVSGALECGDDLAIEVAIILDDKQPHLLNLPPGPAHRRPTPHKAPIPHKALS